MSLEERKKLMNYIHNVCRKDYFKARIDIILSLLYELEEYLDYKNETIDKIIDLIQEEFV